jgi:L-ascorbate metabolism protein UlaG (beta-lactamase superfamily)
MIFDPRTWAEDRVTRIDQSSFLLEPRDGPVVAIDPFGPSPLWKPADLILVTHPHPDHFHPGALRRLLKAGTRVVVPASVRAAGRDRGLATDALAPGETRTIAGVEVAAVAAYNRSKPLHRRQSGWVGYRLVLDGLAVYHAGDTDLIPEMAAVTADVALLPVGGGPTMGLRDALEAARVVGARVVVPMHYGRLPFTGGAGRAFARQWTGTTVLQEPSPKG